MSRDLARHIEALIEANDPSIERQVTDTVAHVITWVHDGMTCPVCRAFEEGRRFQREHPDLPPSEVTK